MRSFSILILATTLAACQAPSAEATAQTQSIETCFEPNDDCIALAVRQIDAATSEVLVQAAGFTNNRIVRALVQAEGRGVSVRMIIDDSRENNAKIRAVAESGAEVLSDDKVTSQHNKIMIFDRRHVLTGSQNFTRASETHAENMLIIHDQPTVDAYVANWERRGGASRPYVSRVGEENLTED